MNSIFSIILPEQTLREIDTFTASGVRKGVDIVKSIFG